MSEPHSGMRAWNEARRRVLDEAEVRRLFDDGHTAKEIAAAFDCSTAPVKKVLKRLGLRRPAKQRPGAIAGARNPAWNGGRRTRVDGYVEIWTPTGPRLEHRVVMERTLGRAVAEHEVVHHRDGNKQNNDPSNLELMTQSEHARHHAPEMHAARYGR